MVGLLAASKGYCLLNRPLVISANLTYIHPYIGAAKEKGLSAYLR
jgi:hypothetical protein